MTERRRASTIWATLAGALGLTLGPALPVAAQEFVPGTGTSASRVAGIELRSSGLTVGFGVGVSRSRFAGGEGNAEADSVDLGLFNTLEKAPLACGYSMGALIPPGAVPPGVLVSSADGPAEKRTASAGAGGPLQLGSQYGAATPNASAAATVDGLSLDLPGVVQVIGGTASSTATLVPGTARQSGSESAMSGLSLGGGLVRLTGLHWTAANRTGASPDSAADFSLGSMSVGGQMLPTGGEGQLVAAFSAANTALAPLGLSLGQPAVNHDRGGAEVGPLRLSVSATPTLRSALAAALVGIQPIRSGLLTFLAPFGTSPDCGLARALGFGYLAVDLATVVLGDQSGAVDLDLGGASAGTDGTAYANPFESGFGLIHPAAPVPAAPAPATSPPPIATGARPVAAVPAAGVIRPAAADVAAPPRSVALASTTVSCRSANGGECSNSHGRLAAWIALALIVALAVADRLRSRLS